LRFDYESLPPVNQPGEPGPDSQPQNARRAWPGARFGAETPIFRGVIGSSPACEACSGPVPLAWNQRFAQPASRPGDHHPASVSLPKLQSGSLNLP